MNKKTTVTLLIVLIALLIGYWMMLRVERLQKQEAVEAKRVFNFEPDEIFTAEVLRADEPLVSATRKQAQPWSMLKPNPTIEANQAIWNRLAVAYAGLLNERTIEKKASDLAKYGLDKPALTISISKQDGKQARLVFGVVDATQTCRYALAEDGSVFLVNVKTFQELDRPLAYLRNPYAVTVGEKGITKLEYSRFWRGKPSEPAEDEKESKSPEPGEESVVVTVEKGDDGRWRLTTPIQADANQEMVAELVKQVQFAVGRGYIEEPKNLADYGLEPPKARITVYCGPESQPQTLYFGSTETGEAKSATGDGSVKGIFAKNSTRPAVFIMDANIGSLLPKTPDAFRERRLMTHPATSLSSIRYHSAETNVILKNDAERGWYLDGRETNEGIQQAVSNFVAFLKVVEGQAFPGAPQPQYGLDAPTIEIVLEFAAGEPSATIRVGAKVPDTEQYYATQDNGTVTILNSIDVAGLTKRPFDFTDRGVLRFRKMDISRIEIIFQGTKYLFEKARGQWTIKEPQNRSISSPSDISTLVAVLSTATATDIDSEMTPTDLAPFGLDKPIAVITAAALRNDSPTEEIIYGPLAIGSTTPDDSQARYASTSMRPGVFRVPQALVDSIREGLKGIR